MRSPTNMLRPLYIFDLDGTLADCQHRTPLLEQKDNPDRWRAFYAACGDDAPIVPVLRTLERLRVFCDVWIFSGRSDEVREQTVAWLERHTTFTRDELELALTMRPANDHRTDDVLKGEWIDGLLDVDRARLVAAFDDRDRVVAAWRARGVPCFQVAPGNF